LGGEGADAGTGLPEKTFGLIEPRQDEVDQAEEDEADGTED